MPLTTVNKYSKPHGAQGGYSGAVYMGSVKNSDLPSDLNVNSIKANTGWIGELSGNYLNYDEGKFVYLFSKNGTVNVLRGDNIEYYQKGYISELTTDSINNHGTITTKELNADKAWIEELNSKYITTEYLTVTKQAHFFELIVDKVRAVGGTLLLSQASCIADYVKPTDSLGQHLPQILVPDDPNDPDGPKHYEEDLESNDAVAFDVYWMAEDPQTGRKNTNDWIVNDQAYCTSFNNVSEGVNYDISNKYYWRLVTAILPQLYMNLRTGDELPTADADKATVNTVIIDTPRVTYTVEGTEHTITTDWETEAQEFAGMTPHSTWEAETGYGGPGEDTKGTMTTIDTVFGIQLEPIADSDLSITVPEKFAVDLDPTTPARINIGVYYTDNSSEWFPASDKAQIHYEVLLKAEMDEAPEGAQGNQGNQGAQGPQGNQAPTYHSTNTSPIRAVVITNADEVEWHLVHGIRLSNIDFDNSGGAFIPDHAKSVPSIGDNIAQLGYRWQGANDPNDKSRGNAIIIAAYKTPDQGTGPNAGQPWQRDPIVPPSYAQYVAIGSKQNKYYNLAEYRQTSFDGNGSRFIGNLYNAAGTDIETLIQTGGADLYQNFTAYCKNYNANPHIEYPTTNWDWIKAQSNMPGGISYTHQGQKSVPIKIQQGQTEADAIAYAESQLTFSDYSWVELPGSTGTPGGHWVNAYKNYDYAYTPPAPPNDDGYGNPSYHGTPVPVENMVNGWNDWYDQPQQLPLGPQDAQGHQTSVGYTWMSQAFINGNGTYQEWQEAVRLTGANGRDGEDGSDIEYIYTRNDGDYEGDPETPYAPRPGYGPGPQGTYPEDWPRHNQGGQSIGYQTITNVDGTTTTWYDNPQGVGEPGTWQVGPQGMQGPQNFKYEYMSQRTRRAGGQWSDYTEPVLWSNWGEKGRDGDGYEYIFVLTGPQCPQGYQGPQAPATPPSDPYSDEYFSAPWTDDPTGVSEGKNKEYCSMRKKQDGVWSNYSTPALWAQWVPAGTQGSTGPQGPQGDNGDTGRMYTLADAGSQAWYSIQLNTQNQTETSWVIQLKYNIYKSEGLSNTPMTATQITNAGIRPYALLKKTNDQNDSFIWYRFDVTTENDIGLCTLTYNKPSSGWQDVDVQMFVYNHPSIRVALLPNIYNGQNYDHYKNVEKTDPDYKAAIDMKYDEISVPFNISNYANWITYAGDMTLPASDPRRYASIKGLVTNTTDNANHITSLTLGVQGIQGSVTSLNKEVYGTENPSVGQQSIIDQQAGSINLMAGEISGIQADLYGPQATFATKGYVGVQTDAVTLGVQNALYDTGIDIGTQSITLKANKVTFANSSGTVSNKITIDPTTGTLHAEDGDFSGTLTAENSSGNKIIIDPTAPSIKGYQGANETFELDTWFQNKSVLRFISDIGAIGTISYDQMNVSSSTSDGYTIVGRMLTERGGDGFSQLQLHKLYSGIYGNYEYLADFKAGPNQLTIILKGLPTSQPSTQNQVWVDSSGYLRIRL